MSFEHVFISYSRADRSYVERLAKHLQAAGIAVWYDVEVDAGQRFGEIIQRNIATCAAFVVVLTPDSVASRWVKDEISYAIHEGRPVIPLMLYPADVPIQLIGLHREDIVDGQLPGDRFVDRLRRLASEPTIQGPSEPARNVASIASDEADSSGSQPGRRRAPAARSDDLTGTEWAGQDSDGDYSVFEFRARSRLKYTCPTGTYGDATWQQTGATVRIDINNGYSTYIGQIAGTTMSGEASNVAKHSWTWSMVRRKVEG